MSKIIFILGGARSGKSTFAVKLAKESKKKKIAFIATGQAWDSEMKKRISLHKQNRPGTFTTFEEPYNAAAQFKRIANKFDIIIVDCLTLLLSNLLLKKYGEKKIVIEMNNILTASKKHKITLIMVSNEVGLGIVPQTRLGRDFRDIAGKVNQIVAQNADSVFFMVSGLPWKIK